jgi:excisionase family DNA binding protein
MHSNAVPRALRLATSTADTAVSATPSVDDDGPAVPVPVGDRILLDVRTAAAVLSLGKTTVNELAAAGQIRSVKVGRRTLFRRRDLEHFASQLADAPVAEGAG